MKLQEYFRLNNLSQKDFAVLVGVSEVHISQILRGIKNPSIQLIRRIETVTKGTVTVTDLFHHEAPSRLKNMEKKGEFFENAPNKLTKNKVDFFHLGPKNKWQNTLDKQIIDIIEKDFKKEMMELGYLID